MSLRYVQVASAFVFLLVAAVPVVRGQATGVPCEREPVHAIADVVDGERGFTIRGLHDSESLGISVAPAGDVNGDGVDDVVIGAVGSRIGSVPGSGAAHVVFGTPAGIPLGLDIATLDGANGFSIAADSSIVSTNDGVTGWSVSATDMNGDGLDDVVVGVSTANPGGHVLVVFGSRDPFPRLLTASELDGDNGFVLEGPEPFTGFSVSGAGDVNGDGVGDVVVGNWFGTGAGGAPGAGRAYVVFGHADPWPASVDLASLDGTDGFGIRGTDWGGALGEHVSSAGDLNGDGLDDVFIAAPRVDLDPLVSGVSGEAYIIFGRASFPSEMSDDDLDGVNGFALGVGTQLGRLGKRGGGIGDFDGDGLDDLQVGNDGARPGGRTGAGEVHVIYGRTTGFPAHVDLRTLPSSEGFSVEGEQPGDGLGLESAGLGDVNGDGLADLGLGAAESGSVHVLFGRRSRPAAIQLGDLDGTDGFRLDGTASSRLGNSVASAGDFDHDGLTDFIVGAPRATANGEPDAGEAHVLLGCTLNRPPIADAGGEYSAECRNGRTTVQLDGSGSVDPDGDDLVFEWATDCPGGLLVDPLSERTALILDSPPPCPVECAVSLTVTDPAGFSDTDATSVIVQDTLPPLVSGGLRPAGPAPPRAAASACSPPSSRLLVVEASTEDACDASPRLLARVIARIHGVASGGGPCVPRDVVIDVAIGEVLDVRLVSSPCLAGRPAQPRGVLSVRSGRKVITAEEVSLEVIATDACGNSAVARHDPVTDPSPGCTERTTDGDCCPALSAPGP